MIKLGEICQRLGLRFEGDPEQPLVGVCELIPGKAKHLAFATKPSQAGDISSSAASVLLIPEALANPSKQGNAIYAANPYLTFAHITQLLAPALAEASIDKSAVIDPLAEIGEGVTIGAFSTIGRASIGEGCVIGSGCHIGDGAVLGEATKLLKNVVIGDNVTLGSRCQVLSNSSIGESGFGYANDGEGRWIPIIHNGALRIGDRVHIGANSSIDRGTISDTVIEDDVIVDNQVQIGHNAFIGAGTAIAASAAIAGSASIGKNCLIGGASAIGGHFKVCDGVTIAGGSVITSRITEAGVYKSGTPLFALKQWQRMGINLRHLIRPVSKQRGKKRE